MEGAEINHQFVEVNGIKMHVAESGEGPVVLFLHGFPELWYSWRHQIVYLAACGYRAVAPDLRGYGDSDAPPDVAAYSIFHIVGDIVALIDFLGQEQVFVVGHDWGALVAWYLCIFRPDKVKALVNLSVAFRLWNPFQKPVDFFRKIYGDDHYICRFQESGVAESAFAKTDLKLLFKWFLILRKPAPFFISKDSTLRGFLDKEVKLPPWLSEEDINYYANKFRKSGFTGGVNYYRNLDRNCELTAPWLGVQVKVPVKFIIGDLDLTYHIPGSQDYIHEGGFKRDVPFLQNIVLMEGVGHFINQEKPNEVSEHIYNFIHQF